MCVHINVAWFSSLHFIIEAAICLAAFFTPTQCYDNKHVTFDEYICEMALCTHCAMLNLHNSSTIFRMFQIEHSSVRLIGIQYRAQHQDFPSLPSKSTPHKYLHMKNVYNLRHKHDVSWCLPILIILCFTLNPRWNAIYIDNSMKYLVKFQLKSQDTHSKSFAKKQEVMQEKSY